MPAGLPDAQMLILVEKSGNSGVTTREILPVRFSECRTTVFHVPEVDYRAFGYEPDFDHLPWQECYDAAKVAHADRDLEHAYDSPDL